MLKVELCLLAFSVTALLGCQPMRQQSFNPYQHHSVPEILDAEADAQPVTTYAPRYPRAGFEQNIEGYSCFLFDISLSGKPENIRLYDSEPVGVFDAEARMALEKWIFRVHQKDGVPVAVKDKRHCLDFRLK